MLLRFDGFHDLRFIRQGTAFSFISRSRMNGSGAFADSRSRPDHRSPARRRGSSCCCCSCCSRRCCCSGSSRRGSRYGSGRDDRRRIGIACRGVFAGRLVFFCQVFRHDSRHLGQGRIFRFFIADQARVLCRSRRPALAGRFFPLAYHFFFCGFALRFFLRSFTGRFFFSLFLGFFGFCLVGRRFFLIYLIHGFDDFIAGQDPCGIEVFLLLAVFLRNFFIDNLPIAPYRFSFCRDKRRFIGIFCAFPDRHCRNP